MATPFTKAQLDSLPCSGCGSTTCDDLLYLKAKCHPDGKTTVLYKRGSGYLRVICAVCETMICEIRVANSFTLN